MKSIYLAFFSALILSLDQVLFKLLVDKVSIKKIYQFANFKIVLLLLLVFSLAFLGLSLWYLALRKSGLSNIYSTTSLYYIFVPLFSFIILKENISFNQAIGFLIITLGALISTL